jgi:hypothetical protein
MTVIVAKLVRRARKEGHCWMRCRRNPAAVVSSGTFSSRIRSVIAIA